MLISLFERAYLLLYESSPTRRQLRRWRSWEHYRLEWLRRESFLSELPELVDGEDPEFATHIQTLAISIAPPGRRSSF